ncbi:hypothetical protein [Streptomyces sp. NPDC001530]|uniref:hypothetical protein n=1 Tax=Streptomyces sp. NPDC001530 TaxID=3364582 RepID=UPI00369FB343
MRQILIENAPPGWSDRAANEAVPLLVKNSGEARLQLWLEPFGQGYWLKPGEAMCVTLYGNWNDYPFATIHETDCLTVPARTTHA